MKMMRCNKHIQIYYCKFCSFHRANPFMEKRFLCNLIDCRYILAIPHPVIGVYNFTSFTVSFYFFPCKYAAFSKAPSRDDRRQAPYPRTQPVKCRSMEKVRRRNGAPYNNKITQLAYIEYCIWRLWRSLPIQISSIDEVLSL